MSGALVIQSLKYKRSEIHGRIAAYEAQIAQARHDLAHVNATIRLFTEPEHQRARYMVSHGFFKKGEIADICVRHLGVDGEMTTRQLAERVMAERKLDASDRTLRNSVVFKVVQALRHAKRRKLVRMVRFESRGILFDDTERLLELANAYLLIHESPLTDALFLLVSKSDEVTTT